MKKIYMNPIQILLFFVFAVPGASPALSQNGWERLPDMPTARGYLSPSVTLHDGKIYVLGGGVVYDDGTQAAWPSNEAYDPKTNTWTILQDMQRDKVGISVATVNNKIYAIGNYHDNIVEEYDPLTDTWIYKDTMPENRWNSNVGVLNDTIYLFGGSDVYKTCRRYDPVSDKWETLPDMSYPRFFGSCNLYNNKFYVFGGFYRENGLINHQNTVEVYDPVTGLWQELAEMPAGIGGQISVVHNDKILLFGGSIANGERVTPVDWIFEYDPASDSWTIMEDMPISRDMPAGIKHENFVYFMGGFVGETKASITNEAWRFNLDYLEPKKDPYENLAECEFINGVWNMDGQAPAGARTTATSCEVNGKICLIGGMQGWSDSIHYYYPEIEVYDPLSDTWDTTTRAPVPKPGAFITSCEVEGKIMLAGGVHFNDTSDAHEWTLYSDVYVYDPVADTWEQKSNLPLPITLEGGLRKIGDKIYTAGGYIGPPDSRTKVTYMYDPETDTWTEKAPMKYARFGHQVQAVNGKLYAMGGSTSSGSVSRSAEVYDPETDIWSDIASMNYKRFNFSSCVIGGEIYVIGGTEQMQSNPVMTIEKYNPINNAWIIVDDIPESMVQLAMSAVNRKIYVLGKVKDSGDGQTVADNVWEYKLHKIVQYNPVPLQKIGAGSKEIISMTHYLKQINKEPLDYSICSISDESVVSASFTSYRLKIEGLSPGTSEIRINAEWGLEKTGAVVMVEVVAPDAIKEQVEHNNSVLIYPNPATNLLTIDFNHSNDQYTRVELYNITGKVLYSEETKDVTHTLDLSGLPQGLYFIRIGNNEFTITEKVIKVK